MHQAERTWLIFAARPHIIEDEVQRKENVGSDRYWLQISKLMQAKRFPRAYNLKRLLAFSEIM